MKDSINNLNSINDHASILKLYYARYLREVRYLSEASVKKYLNALNNISRRLKEKDLVCTDIFEIADLEKLIFLRDVLFSDSDFIALDERGNRMYSSGLNNYCRFASGDDFKTLNSDFAVMDLPIKPEAAVTIEYSVWKRSGILRAQALRMANYSCAINSKHESFIAENTQMPYMEGHHLMPMIRQDNFDVSLDVYANIVCLCPLCHRQIHHGLKRDRVDMTKQIYRTRSARLANSGIYLSENEFVAIATENR